MSLWPIAMVAMVPSGQPVWLKAAGARPPVQRVEAVRVAAGAQVRRPLRVVQVATAVWRRPRVVVAAGWRA